MPLKLVSGKGGVGKTYVTALLYRQNAAARLFDCQGDLRQQLEKLNLSSPNIELRNDSQLIRNTLKKIVIIDKIASWAADHRVIQNLFRLAPNLLEFLFLLQMIELAESDESDLIVDAPSTGNFLGLLKSVQSAKRMFDAGLMKKNSGRIFDFLNDPDKTEFILVALPERSALDEMIELEKEIKNLFPRAKIIRVLNRKHEEEKNWKDLPPELHFLAHDRVIKENKRVKDLHFDFILKEAEVKLV